MIDGAGRRDCRVTRIDTYVVGARWVNWVFAHVFTDDGLEGVGEGTCEFQPKAVHLFGRCSHQRDRGVVLVEAAFLELRGHRFRLAEVHHIEGSHRDHLRNALHPRRRESIGASREHAAREFVGKFMNAYAAWVEKIRR